MNRILKVATIAATASLCAFAAEEKQATRPRQGNDVQTAAQGGGKSAVRARMSQDVAVYGRDGMREIERLYRAYSSKAENADEALKSLIEKYPKDKYPLSFIKAHGGSVVRSARSMPKDLYDAIKKSR